jgi:hypothetical protein
MADQDKSTVVGVFHHIEDADQAVHELLRAGFRREDIGFVHLDETKGDEMKEDSRRYDRVATTRVAEGALAGTLVGGLIGTVMAIVFPGVGTLAAAGLLIAGMAGAGAIGGTFSAMMSLVGVSEEEAEWFKGELEKGHPIVAVRTDGRYSEALAILQTYGAYDMDREKEVRPPAAPVAM